MKLVEMDGDGTNVRYDGDSIAIFESDGVPLNHDLNSDPGHGMPTGNMSANVCS